MPTIRATAQTISTVTARRAALLLTIAGAFACSGVASAQAATYTLRPSSTLLQAPSWSVSPSGSTAFAVLGDAVAQPAAPSTTTDFAQAIGAGGLGVAFPAPAIGAGETTASVTAWVYAGTGTLSLTPVLYSGSTILGFTSILPGQAPGWHRVVSTQALSAAALGQLSVYLQSTAWTTSNTATKAYATYIEVQTTDPAPAATLPTPATVATEPLGVPTAIADAPAVLPLAPVVALPSSPRVSTTAAGDTAQMTVGCPATAVGGCHGTVTLRAVSAPVRHAAKRKAKRSAKRSVGTARASRCGRGCRPIGTGSFDVNAGARVPVTIHVASTTAGRLRSGRTVRAQLTVTTSSALTRPRVQRRTVVLAAPRHA